jgi:transposase
VPRAFSLDLRTRIVHACRAQEYSQPEIAEIYQVHLKTVEKYWRMERDGQSLVPRRRQKGSGRKLQGHEEQFRALVAERPDDTLAEWSAAMEQRHSVQISPSVLCRTLREWKVTRKKRR